MFASRLPPWALLPLGLAPLLAVVLLGGNLPRQATLLLASGAVLWALTATVLHWKRLDEAAKSAHRWAWYWGSSFGLGIALLVAAAAYMWPAMLDAARPWAETLAKAGRPQEASWLLLGVIGAGVAQAAGFLGAFVYWWTLKR